MTDAHGGSPAAQPAAGTGSTQAGLLVDVAGESSTDKPAARPTAQPAADIDTAGAIPEDTFTKYDYSCFDNCQQILSVQSSAVVWAASRIAEYALV